VAKITPIARMRDKVEGAAERQQPPPPRELPVIQWTPGELPRVVDEGEAALLAMPGGSGIYQRGGSLVQIIPRPPANSRRIKRADGGIAIGPVDLPRVVEVATAAGEWVKADNRTGGVRRINAPHEFASVLLARGKWGFSHLTGIIEQPTLRPDGTVLDAPGYDAATGLYFDSGGVQFPPINPNPDRAQALAGLDALRDVLREFPFATEVDRAVAIAMMLTALVRLSVTHAPLFGISATVMGSGKTYLAHCASLLIAGRPAPVMTPSRDEKEEAKALFAALLTGDVILLLDNVEHQLASDRLCAILTSEVLRDRVLGLSKTAEASTACTLIVTGNNLELAGDLSARALVCRLQPKEERPEHRRFERDLMQWIPEQRGQLVAGALEFLRGYLVSGERPDIEPWQRFPEWDALIRRALVWAGLPDLLESLRAVETSDPRRIEHEAVMAAWQAEFADELVTVRALAARALAAAAVDDHAFKDALLNVAGERDEVNLKRLGKWLAKMAGRIQSGMRIERGTVQRGTQTWRVRK
jgi:putative DNA primase/helicase